jgi:hypothetical protein
VITSEELRARQCIASKKWRDGHPGAQVAANARWGKKNPGAMAAALREWCRKNPEKALLQNARRRAKAKGIPFDLVHTDLMPLPTHCPVLGIKLEYGPGRGRKLYENRAAASLDRIHNHLGYVKGNVIIVSLRANLLKGQATIDELQMIADFYRRLSR